MSFTRDLGLERMCLFPLNYLTADNMVVISAVAYKDHAVCLPHCQSGLCCVFIGLAVKSNVEQLYFSWVSEKGTRSKCFLESCVFFENRAAVICYGVFSNYKKSTQSK